MKIVLIYLKYGSAENQPNIKCVADNYGVFPPLNLAQVAAVIETTGHDVRIIDCNVLDLTEEELIKEIKNYNPDIIGFTITTYFFHETVDFVRYLKTKIRKPVLIGGMHLSFYPRETFSYNVFDYGIIGNCEESLPQLLDVLNSKNYKGLEQLRGIIYMEGKKIMINPPKEPEQNIDSYPFPARHLLLNEKYNSFISQFKNFTAMISSRGCPYRCIFCEQRSKKFYARSAKSIVDEMEECEKRYGVREIDIFDSSFTIIKRRVIDVCKEYRARKLKVKWSIRTRVDLVDTEVLDHLSESGCIRIYYGIESGNKEILKTLRKSTNLSQIKKVLKATKKRGIATFGYFMIGSPGETEETIKETIAFAKSLKLDYAQFSKLSTLPGTDLYDLLKKEIKEDYWRNYILDKSKKKVLPRYNTDLTEEQIEYWVKRAYKDFYFRPNYIFKALLRLKTWDEFKRSLKAAAGMVRG